MTIAHRFDHIARGPTYLDKTNREQSPVIATLFETKTSNFSRTRRKLGLQMEAANHVRRVLVFDIARSLSPDFARVRYHFSVNNLFINAA